MTKPPHSTGISIQWHNHATAHHNKCYGKQDIFFNLQTYLTAYHTRYT